jgi:NitT/TauT family transport system permease protein
MLTGELLIHSLYSLFRLFFAVLLALLTGVSVGIGMGMSRRIESILAPLVYVLFPVPKAALLPILFVLFGLGDGSKIMLVWLILFFQVVLSVFDAVKNISEDVFLSAKTLRLTKPQIYRHIVFPAILPNVLSALRTSVGIGIAVLFFAETYATQKGLGYFIMNNWSMLNYKEMYSGIVLMGAIGYCIFSWIDWLKLRLVKWTGDAR